MFRGFRCQDSGCRGQGSGVQGCKGLGLKFQSLGFKVSVLGDGVHQSCARMGS